MGPSRVPGSAGDDYNLSNPVGSFTDVVRRVVASPAQFFSGIPRRGNYLAPLVFALICLEISTILGGLLRLAVGTEATGGVRFSGIAYSFGDFIADVILAPVGGAIGLFIFAAIAHILVMLFVGNANSGYEATFRVLMVWVYDRTGSLLVAMLMHMSLTTSSLILGAGVAGVPLVTFDLIWAAVLWAVVAAVAVAQGGHLSREAPRRRVA